MAGFLNRIKLFIDSKFNASGFKRAHRQMIAMRKISQRTGLTMAEVATAQKNMGTGFQAFGGNIRTLGGEMSSLDDAVAKTSDSFQNVQNRTRQFRFEFLSLMFAGMALQKMMFGLLRPAFKAAGIFDLISTILQLLFLPTALKVLDLILDNQDAILGMKDSTKELIGDIVLFLGAFGAALKFLGMFKLAMDGVSIMLSKNAGLMVLLSTKAKAVGGAILDVLSVLRGKGFLAALGRLVTLLGGPLTVALGLFAGAYLSNFLGIRDITNVVVGTIIDGFMRFIDIVREAARVVGDVLAPVLEPLGKILFPKAQTGIGEFKSVLPNSKTPTSGPGSAGAAASNRSGNLTQIIQAGGGPRDNVSLETQRTIERAGERGMRRAMSGR